MGRRLYDTQPVFRAELDRCDRLVRTSLGRSIVPHAQTESETFDRSGSVRLAVFVIEYALAVLWRSWGIEPAAVMGTGVGEYAAACVTGLVSLEEALRLLAAGGESGRFGIETTPPALELFLEIGPHPALAAERGVRLPSLCKGEDELRQILSSLGALYERGADVDWAGFDHGYARRRLSLPTYPFERQRYWLETDRRRPARDAEPTSSPAPQPRAEVEQSAPARRLELMRAYVHKEVAQVLGLDESAAIDPHRGFFDMGMESLTVLQLKSSMEKGLGCALPTTFAMNYPTIETLAAYVTEQVLGLQIAASPEADAVAAEIVEDPVPPEIEDLSEEELAALLDTSVDRILGGVEEQVHE